jgi:hypothetical protein
VTTPATPDALLLARAARLSGDPMSAPPHVLWAAAQVGPHLDRGELYVHAMTEAGHLVSTATGEPFVICPDCGWRPE